LLRLLRAVHNQATDADRASAAIIKSGPGLVIHLGIRELAPAVIDLERLLLELPSISNQRTGFTSQIERKRESF
jgi:hypothetical protein